MPPAVFSSASSGSTTTRSSSGRIFRLTSFSFAMIGSPVSSAESYPGEPGRVRSQARRAILHHSTHAAHSTHASHPTHAAHVTHAAAVAVMVVVVVLLALL